MPSLLLPLLHPPALAAPPLLVPGGELVAGEEALVEWFAPRLAAETRLQVVVKGGSAGTVERRADGRLRVPVRPDAPGEVVLELRLGASGGKEAERYVLPVRPSMSAGLVVTGRSGALPARVLAGEGPLDLRVRPAGEDPRRPDQRRLAQRALLGRWEAAVPDAEGWSARYTPPARLDAPAFEVLAFTDLGAPGASFGHLVLPLAARTELRLPAEPGASCALVVAGERFAPDAARPDGELLFTIDLPPGQPRGELLCQQQGQAQRRTVDLPSGQRPTLALLPTLPVVPSGGSLPLQLVVLDALGQPQTSGPLPTLQASAGTVEDGRWQGDGLASIRWTAPGSAGRVRLVASWLDARAEIEVEVVERAVPPRPVDPRPPLVAGKRDTPLTLGDGRATAVLSDAWTVRGRPDGPVLALRPASGRQGGSLSLVGALPASAGGLAAVVGWAETPVLGPGVREPVGVLLATVDPLGLPVAGVDLRLSVEGGKAPSSVRTDAQGRARIAVQPERDGLLVLRAEGGGLRVAVPVLVGLAEAPLLDPPGGGTADELRLREIARAWAPAVLIQAPGGPVRHLVPPPSEVPAPRIASPDPRRPRLTQRLEALVRPPAGPSEEPDPEQSTRQAAAIDISWATVPHSYGSRSSGLHGIPSRVKADQGDLLRGRPIGAPALIARLELPAWKALAWESRLAGRYEGYLVRETAFTRLDVQGSSGLKWRLLDEGPGQPFLLAQAEYARVPIFTYATFREEDPDKSTGARMLVASVPGARLGGGLELDLGALDLRLEGSETMAPWPVHTRGELDIAIQLARRVAIRAGLELGFRSMRFDLGEERVRVTDQQHAISLGLRVRPR